MNFTHLLSGDQHGLLDVHYHGLDILQVGVVVCMSL